ncbi:uncharacterized protein Z518_07612 [Rhinocladiella mackenziei CBS 650.93]|uniref:Stc1 domain-containing protein n=1 Tax=Rhinocladiella mackenziei CBS 650.93 TaxID=1442369 RepID=A0A0D2IE20_9EURO|nr:uncharacterized protein Z518_07612 [Rhinocladiella mackenziei CBS 650.93]KIX04059.1 hypothetical protein Z518_07612 [Rhinocladiella mackenziei CBS 650.93]
MPSSAQAADWASRFDNVDIGQTIRCSVCNKNLILQRFSGNQLKKYKEAVFHERRAGVPAPLPRCTTCTAGNVVELYCTVCRTTLPVDFFSRNHRSKPDQAKCRNCQQGIEDQVPGLREAVEEEEIREEFEAKRPGPFSGMSSVGSALPSISGSVSGSGRQSQAASTTGDGVYMGQYGEDHESAWGGRVPTDRSPSPASTAVSGLSGYPTRSTSESSFLRTGSTYSSGTARGGFHKQGAYKPSANDRVLNRIQRDDVHQQQKSQAGSKEDGSDDESEIDFEL